MIGILPGRLATRQRLFVGVVIVAITSLLNLIAVELGPFGSPWPIALLWAASGWAGLGPNVTTAALLFSLGLWVDVLVGTPFGTWSGVTLLTHGIVILMARYLGTSNLGRLGRAIICACVMLLVMTLIGLWQGGGINFLSAILPLGVAVGLNIFVGKFFELSEGET